MTDWAYLGKLTTVTVACIAIAVVIVKRAREFYVTPFTPKPVEQERADVVSIVAYAAQHNPGVSVGDWPDEHSIDPAYDALEAIRPQVAGQ